MQTFSNINNLDKDIKARGVVVGGDYNNKGNYIWAEIEPSGGKWHRRFLPNVKFWWYEINETEVTPTDELGIGAVTHAYEKGGSGGAWTFRGCVIKAQLAIDNIARTNPKPTKEEGKL